MKRILGLILAIVGELAFGATASAAQVSFDVSGVVGYWLRSGDANAAVPGPPNFGGSCGATGLASSTPGSAVTCFRYAFGPGSAVTVDITGSAVTIVGGTLNVRAITPLVFGTIVIDQNFVTTLAAGAAGTLTGDIIQWSTLASVTHMGTITCTGPNCSLISLPPGIAVPLQPTLSGLTNTTPVAALNLGQWRLNPPHTALTGSTTAVTAISNVVEDSNRNQAGFTFGPILLGVPGQQIPALRSHWLAGLALLLGALILVRGRVQTGRMPRFFAGSGSSGRDR